MEKDLLQRYIEGNVSIQEIETVVDWLDADEKNVKEFMALHKVYDISLFNKTTVKASYKKNKKIPLRKVAYQLLKIASVFLLFFLINYLFYNNKEDNTDIPVTYQTFFTPAGQRAELTLPDSTRVWLNAKSSITYSSDFLKGDQLVVLDGEAYFDVTHKKKKPFIVKTEDIEIEVFGTEFNVCAYSGSKSPEVALLTGNIVLKTNTVNKKHEMKPNEQVKLEDGKLYVSQIDKFDYFKWKEGILSFENEPVESIIKKLELYFDIRIEVKGSNLLNYSYSGKFRTDDGVEQVLKVLQLEHGFIYTRDRELNLITIK